MTFFYCVGSQKSNLLMGNCVPPLRLLKRTWHQTLWKLFPRGHFQNLCMADAKPPDDTFVWNNFYLHVCWALVRKNPDWFINIYATSLLLSYSVKKEWGVWSRKRREMTNFPNSGISHLGEIGVLTKLYLPCQGVETWVCGCIGMTMWVMGN